MKKIVYTLLLLLSLYSPACIASGFSSPSPAPFSLPATKTTIKRSVKIGAFNQIQASAGITVIMVVGKATGVAQISTTESANPYLKVEVKNKTLKVYYDSHRNTNINGPTVVTVQAPYVQSVSLTSAASFKVKGEMNVSGNLALNLTSASSADMPYVKASKVTADLTSSASVKFQTLSAQGVNVNASSTGGFSAEYVTAPKLSLSLSSMGEAKINDFTGSQLNVISSSSGSCKIKSTSAKDLNLSASSGATIKVWEVNADTLEAIASSGGNVSVWGYAEKVGRSASSGGKVYTSWSSNSNLKSKSSSKSKSSTKSSSSKKTTGKRPVPTQAP